MPIPYIMENAEETERLEMKTDSAVVAAQAGRAGLLPGMRVADIGCGPGKTTSILGGIAGITGSAVGFDGSEERIEYARRRYGSAPASDAGADVSFIRHDLREPIEGLPPFDFVWVRFFLEYHRTEAFNIVRNCASILKPGGILCLVDLDHNCMSHYGITPRLEKAVKAAISILEEKADFDPYAGRKLYSHLYRNGFSDISVHMEAHHLIFGILKETDEMNWMTKVTVLPEKVRAVLPGYESIREFQEDFRAFFTDPGRFSYTPLIACWGRKPLSAS